MIYLVIRISLCLLSILCFSLGVSFLWRIKKLVTQNLGKSLSRSDYLQTKIYVMKFKYYVYIGFLQLQLALYCHVLTNNQHFLLFWLKFGTFV